VSKVDQQSDEQAAPEWMTKRPDSKVNQFISALRTLITEGGLSVNTRGPPVYVTGDKAAIVVPRSIGVVRHYLKQQKTKLHSNHCLDDLPGASGSRPGRSRSSLRQEDQGAWEARPGRTQRVDLPTKHDHPSAASADAAQSHV